jgi:hypothetical protein
MAKIRSRPNLKEKHEGLKRLYAARVEAHQELVRANARNQKLVTDLTKNLSDQRAINFKLEVEVGRLKLNIPFSDEARIKRALNVMEVLREPIESSNPPRFIFSRYNDEALTIEVKWSCGNLNFDRLQPALEWIEGKAKDIRDVRRERYLVVAKALDQLPPVQKKEAPSDG